MKRKKKFLIYAVVFFLTLIPILYSGLFLGALMDPYGKVDQLPVALVKENDNPIYNKLVESKLFDYKEENASKAKKDLDKGNVYAIITFDEGFTNKLTAFPVTQQQPTMTLTTSEGLNYSAAKLIVTTTEQFVSKVNAGLSSQMISQLNAKQVPTNIASIIHLEHKDIHPVKNNGEGMGTLYLLFDPICRRDFYEPVHYESIDEEKGKISHLLARTVSIPNGDRSAAVDLFATDQCAVHSHLDHKTFGLRTIFDRRRGSILQHYRCL